MDKNSTEVENLIVQAKKLQEVSRAKRDLENTLKELTFCNNVALLSKRLKIFNEKVLRVSCKLVASSMPTLEGNQTLLITVQNVSEKFVFNSDHWQFCVSMNHDRTQSTWNLDTSLGPGQKDTFCCSLNKTFPLEIISISLKFILQFESKTYTRSFEIQECIVDALHCLDPGRNLSEANTLPLPIVANQNSFLDICTDNEPKVSFPPITKFLLKLDASLKEKFVKDILLSDSFHRGFSDGIEELMSKPEISVYYLGNKIDIKLSLQSEIVAVKCLNPTVLCAVKASILRRLVRIEGIVVDGLDDESLEKLHSISLKLNAFESECSPDSIDVEELMEFYLELRDVSESIRFSIVHVVE